jgi:hypothetical protein
MQLVQPAVMSGPWRLPQTSPPPELLLVLLDVLVAVEPPQTLVLGTQTCNWLPSASGSVVQVRSAPHGWPAEQSGAQYSSPPNWAQNEPLAQFESWMQGGQATAAPPAPLDDAVVVPVLVAPPCAEVLDVPDDMTPPLDPHARSRASGAAPRATVRT